MIAKPRPLSFRERDFKGSRLRCLLATSGVRSQVAAFLASLAHPYAAITDLDTWAPEGLISPAEASLDKIDGFLSPLDQIGIKSWWLANGRGRRTPNWDIVTSFGMSGRHGLLLVEAKSHEGEFSADSCSATDTANLTQIRKAMVEAEAGWNALLPGFALSTASHYQLSNRFAFAWKLAEMGIPTVLVYLGFLDAHEMQNGSNVLLRSHDQWRQCVLKGSHGIVPVGAWGRTFTVNGTPLTAVIRSARVDICTSLTWDGATP